MTMKKIVKNIYLNPNRNGVGLEVFLDFPQHVLHLKNKEERMRYYLMYFSEKECQDFQKSCGDSNIITMYDNSYFEYKLKGESPDMTHYINDITLYHPDIVMADVDYSEYSDTWAEYANITLSVGDTLLMVIPHGNSIEEVANMIYNMNHDSYVDIIGLPYQFNGFNRTDIIAYCVAHNMWCDNKAVHLLGLPCANEIHDHRDLIRICQNIKSIDTSYPVLLGCGGVKLTVDSNKKFEQDKPTFNIVNCPTDNTDEELILYNIKTFKDNITELTSGYAKIALIGAAGTGKTTTALKLNELLGKNNSIYIKYPGIHKVCDYRDQAKADLATALYTGCNIMAAHLCFNNTAILDRCLIDNIAYAEYNKNDMQVDVFKDLFKSFGGNISSFGITEPLCELDIEDDGKRITDKNVQKQLHNTFMNVIQELECNVVTLKGDMSVEKRIESLLKSI